MTLRSTKRTMFRLSIDEFKSTFFRPERVNSAVDKAAFAANRDAARYVQRVAKTLLNKKGKRLSESELLPWQAESLKARRRRWHQLGGDPSYEPKPPRAASPPGQPPYKIVGLIRKHVYFGLRYGERSAIIGPALLGKPKGPQTGVEAHEKGGRLLVGKGASAKLRKFPPRPFMVPALKKTIAVNGGLQRFWKEKVKP